jgi:hypothetical protein
LPCILPGVGTGVECTASSPPSSSGERYKRPQRQHSRNNCPRRLFLCHRLPGLSMSHIGGEAAWRRHQGLLPALSWIQKSARTRSWAGKQAWQPRCLRTSRRGSAGRSRLTHTRWLSLGLTGAFHWRASSARSPALRASHSQHMDVACTPTGQVVHRLPGARHARQAQCTVSAPAAETHGGCGGSHGATHGAKAALWRLQRHCQHRWR